MADGTHIEWTDATWNIVNGCSVLSPGCTNCYAMRLAGTRLKHHPSREGLTIDTKAGPVWTGEVRFNDKVLLDPIRWRRPRKIFVCAHGDLFHENVPNGWIDQVFSVMASAKHHVFQVLTKRPDRMRVYVSSFRLSPLGFLTRDGEEPTSYGGKARDSIMPNERWPLPNVWLGVSVEDQQRADDRIPILLDTPAAVRWLSCEPLLGPVCLTSVYMPIPDGMGGAENCLTGDRSGVYVPPARSPGAKIDWVVAGGESGQGARPMHPDWARSLRDQCAAAGVPFLFKQWGEWAPDDGEGGCDHLDKVISAPALKWVDGAWRSQPKLISERQIGDNDVYRLGKKSAGRLLDGVQHDGYPA